jgi:hypothetical protein
MKNRNALQQLTIPAIFANLPMLNIGQDNELHNHGTFRKTFLPQIIQIQELSGNCDRGLLAHLAAVPNRRWRIKV